MSWTQWPVGQPPPSVAAAPPLINPAPAVVPPLPYTATDQWSQMQQQNWQQWAQWQQQYQQWHQQYGAEYQKSMSALAAQQPVVHNLGVPPPLPIEPQPPLPLDEVPKPAPPLPGVSGALPLTVPLQPPVSQYTTQPPPSNNFSAPPPNFSTNQQNWRQSDNASLDQKRPLVSADESVAKRQMLSKQVWKGPTNALAQTTQNWQNSSNLEELSEAEKKFDKQFAEWEAQFNKWKDQNSGHPDKQQYKEYEKKWEQWRQQLLDRREAMRKKRLGLTAANKATPNQNFSIPPPSQGQTPTNTPTSLPMNPQSVPVQKLPPTQLVQPKEPLLPTPDTFTKPPPNLNDEPLQFKKPDGEEEHQAEALGFLNASKSDGIPGLDLVKDGEPEREEENSEKIPQKGPDLEAISKGINNILGDQKLMSMLSMVSQTQNVSENSNINTMSKIREHMPPVDQSNLSMDESPKERFMHSEMVQNFDDQTRSSFTMQANDTEFYRGMPPGSQLNQGGFQMNFDVEPPFNRGPMPSNRFDNRQWSGPGDDDFRRPPPNRFGRGLDNTLVSDQSRGPIMNKNSGNFEGHPSGHIDDFNSRNSDRRNNFGLSGQSEMNRDSFVNARMERDMSGPVGMSRNLQNRDPSSIGGMNREQIYSGSVNRAYGPEVVNRGGFGQRGMNRDSFGPVAFNQDSLGPGGIARNNLESAAMNRDSFGSSGMNRGPTPGSGGLMRDSLGSSMIRESGVPGVINRDSFGPTSMNRNELASSGPGHVIEERFGPGNRDNFVGVSNMNRLTGLGGPSKERLELIERGNMNRDKFESQISNLGGRAHFESHNMTMDRDDFVSGPPDGKFGNRVPNPSVRKNSRCEDFDYGDDAPSFGTSFDDNSFRYDRGLGDDRRDDYVAPLENFNHRRNERMSIDSRKDRFSQETVPLDHRDVRNDDYKPRGFGLPFNEDELRRNFDGRNELYPNRKGDRFLSRSFGNDGEQNFRGNFHGNLKEDEENYPPPPPIYGHQASSDKGPVHNRNSIVNSLLDAPDPPHLHRGAFDDAYMMEEQYSRDAHGNDFPDHIMPVEPPIDIWKPAKVIDYDHKSLNELEMEILVEPFRMFDYRHKPLDRIPFPDRPNWLSDAVRMIPEFDPPLIRAPIERRMYEERYELLRKEERYEPIRMDDRYSLSRADNRYDVSRIDDRYDPYRYERRAYSRFSPPSPRREYDDNNWSSSRKNRSRSPLRFEKPPLEGDRGERNRSRDRGKDWETESRNKKGESRDLEEKKVSSKDWSDKDVRRERDEYRDRGEREEYRDRGEREEYRERDQYKDRDNRDDNKDRGDRDGFKNRGRDDYKSRGDRGDYRDRGDGDEYRSRVERDDYRDRGRDWKPTSNKEDNSRNKEWEERGKQWEVDSVDMDNREGSRERDVRYKNDRNVDRDISNDFNRRMGGELFPLARTLENKKLSNVTMIEDLINPPGRSNRPPRIVIILRGPPGSGKTYLAKLIKDKEVENGGSAPRILSLDDYFMVEQEKEIIEDGRRVKTKDMVYEFEAEMEEAYRASLMRSFKKTITDGYFSFIIVDNVNDKVKHFGEMWSFAKQNGFQVYISQLDLDVQNCTKRNVHNRTEDDIRKCVEGWEDTPSHHPVLDVAFLTQGEPISEVEMEEINSPGSDAVDDALEDHLGRSKWDNFDCSINNLARLDGVNKPLRTSRTMEEYLQCDDEWQPTKSTKPGQKRVRWADLEERKQQEKMRAIGFVVGQTDWERMMDPSMGQSALTQTKYIEKAQRRRF